ncbi:MAG TPA: hypothetical protein VI956_08730 [Nitrospirota bacterium]|nr:hypothetical protein [Nitrospirota bacterium]
MKTMNILILVVIVVVAGIAIYSAQKKSFQKTEFKNTDEMMTYFAAEAVKDAAKENHVKLDYSVQSIEKVEAVLSKIHEQYLKDKTSIAVNGLAMAYGAYIGEVIKRTEPDAKWERDHPVAGEKSYPIHWRGGESFPCGWCFKRITSGPEDNVWHKYQILKQQRS